MKVPQFDADGAAQQLGTEGVNNLVDNAERFCGCEEQRIALSNVAQIVSLQGQFTALAAEDHHLEQRLQMAPPPGDVRRLRRRAIYYWSLTVILTIAGFVFTLLSFEPFRLGWKGWLYSAGIAVLTPFLVENLLDGKKWERIVTALTATAAIAAIASLMTLAAIRGNILAQQIHRDDAPAVVDDDAEPAAAPENTFYNSTLGLLRFALLLFAFSMELGAGLVLREAWRSAPDDSEDWNKLRKELAEVRKRMCDIVYQVTMLRNEPGIFAARFWRDFYRAMLSNAVRNAMTKLPIIMLMVLAFFAVRARAETHSSIVIAIDLTQSVATPGPDGKDDFQKNIDGTTRVLAQVPGGSHVAVIGITDHSYAQPYMLLSARIPDDPGYFGERLTAARGQLIRAWKLRSSHLTPHFQQTDILGALQLANDIFAQQPDAGRKILVIFSDMRQNTSDLDLESVAVVPSFPTVARGCGTAPAFNDVQGYVLGVDGAGKSRAYWHGLRRFWGDYFRSAGATLLDYSVLRELPQDLLANISLNAPKREPGGGD